MQTSFTPAQLRDPDTAEAQGILRNCVHCGFCTATCPTYVLLGDELDSPRGRIYLMKEMLESGAAASEGVVRHVDRCLSCLACVTTCPSGVDYRHLVEHARVHIERTYRRPWRQRVLRAALAGVLPYPRRLRAAMFLGQIARPLAPLLPRSLRAMLRLVPAQLGPALSQRREVSPVDAVRRKRVVLLTGCAQSVLAPSVHAATVRLLNRAGAEVVTVSGCCGALVHHMGRDEAGLRHATALLQGLREESARGEIDAVVSTASGCGLHIKDYAHVFRHDPALRDVAARYGALARDVTEVIAELGLPPGTVAPGEVVAYHSPCSMQHGQRLDQLPRELLRAAGYQVRDIEEGHLCCGSAGTYNLLQPEIATQLRARKLERIRRTGAQLVATGNVGCAMQLSGPGELAVVHTVELLERASAPGASS